MAGCVLLAGLGPARAEPVQGFYQPEPTECLSPAQRAAIQKALAVSAERLRAEHKLPTRDQQSVAAAPTFRWPVQASTNNTDPGVHGISNFVDQNTNAVSLRDYNCGSRTYDGHHGTDIFSWPFYWLKMDRNEVEIVAAAPGVILSKSDGNYDRNCAMGGATWNAVYIQHADGSVAWYGHLKSNSLTSKAVGAAVAEGEYLGLMGSSGSSTGPHLHFEVYDAASHLVDPWQGSCNALNTGSWWQVQRPYYDSAINKISTHSNLVTWPACPTAETPNTANVFQASATVYFYSFYRDQLVGDVTSNTVFQPDGSTYTTWLISNTVYYASSWWYNSTVLPASPQRGTWTYRTIYKGVTNTHRFFVGTSEVRLSASNQPAYAMLNSNLIVYLTVTNASAASATYVSVTNVLPAGVTFVAASAGGSQVGGVVSWTLASLAAGAWTQISATVQFTNTNAVVALTNTARISTGTYDTNVANNVTSLVVAVDHDGDGVPTALEAGGDANGNGVASHLDGAETFDLVALNPGASNTWAAFSGAVYQLQYTTNFLSAAGWTNLGGAVTAQSATLTVTDTNVAAQRAYRVWLQRLP